MHTRRTIILLVMVSGLVSCQSFNHYTVINGKAVADATIDPTKKPGPGLAESLMHSDNFIGDGGGGLPPDPNVPKNATLNVICPVYKLPDLPPMPDLPYDALAKAAQTNNNNAFDREALEHIKQLHEYINNTRKILRDSHQQYLRECASYVSGQH